MTSDPTAARRPALSSAPLLRCPGSPEVSLHRSLVLSIHALLCSALVLARASRRSRRPAGRPRGSRQPHQREHPGRFRRHWSSSSTATRTPAAPTFAGWTQDGCMLISTRFAETAQAHRVCQPMGMREQLTFYPEPLAAIEARAGRRRSCDGFVFGKDVGGNEFWQLHWFDLKSRGTTLLTDGKARNQSPLFCARRQALRLEQHRAQRQGHRHLGDGFRRRRSRARWSPKAASGARWISRPTASACW